MGWLICLVTAALVAVAPCLCGAMTAALCGEFVRLGSRRSLSVYLILGLCCFIVATLLSPFVGFGLEAIGIGILVVLFAFTVAFALFERGKLADSYSRLPRMGGYRLRYLLA